jgi:hypothetical protein
MAGRRRTTQGSSFSQPVVRRGVHQLTRARGFALQFGRLWYAEPNAISNAVGYAKFYSRSHDAVIHVYDYAGNVIVRQEHAGKEW